MVRPIHKIGLGMVALTLASLAFANHLHSVHGYALKTLVNPAKIMRSVTWDIAREEVMGDRPARNYSVLLGDEPEPSYRRTISLTIDDGPHPGFTSRILAILNRYHVPATFFVVGKEAERYPWLVQEEFDQGFTVGNHSYSHATLTKLPFVDALADLRACNDVIQRITGQPPRYLRPPGGDIDPRTMKIAATEGLRTALWTDDPGDYSNPGTKVILDRTMRKLSPGGILLLHDGSEQMLEVLPILIKEVEARGYRFIPIQDLPITRYK